MKRLNGWQWLWIVGFIPWVLFNSWAMAYVDDEWLGIMPFVEFVFPSEPEGAMIIAAFLVPYIVLYYFAKLSWRATLWVRAGFREKSPH